MRSGRSGGGGLRSLIDRFTGPRDKAENRHLPPAGAVNPRLEIIDEPPDGLTAEVADEAIQEIARIPEFARHDVEEEGRILNQIMSGQSQNDAGLIAEPSETDSISSSTHTSGTPVSSGIEPLDHSPVPEADPEARDIFSRYVRPSRSSAESEQGRQRDIEDER